MNKNIVQTLIKTATEKLIKRKMGVDSSVSVNVNVHGVIELKVRLLVEDVQTSKEAYLAACYTLNELIIDTVELNGKVHDVNFEWTGVDELKSSAYHVYGDMTIHVTFNPHQELFTDSKLTVITTSSQEITLDCELKNITISDVELCA